MGLFQRRTTAQRTESVPAVPGKKNGHGGVDTGGRGRDAYYDLKTRIHRQLIERLDLAKLDILPLETVQQQIRRIVEDMLAGDDTPPRRQEREPPRPPADGGAGGWGWEASTRPWGLAPSSR